jgi:hypothetical protein
MSERDARPGLRVPFEGYRSSLVSEFSDDINGPRTMLRGVDATAGVVLGTPFRQSEVRPV